MKKGGPKDETVESKKCRLFKDKFDHLHNLAKVQPYFKRINLCHLAKGFES